MQFNVPQFIEIEDKIIGPFTLKQFLILIGAGALIFFLWYFFQLWFVVLIAAGLAGFLGAVFFVKINGRPFFTYLLAGLNYFLNPKIYIWKRKE